APQQRKRRCGSGIAAGRRWGASEKHAMRRARAGGADSYVLRCSKDCGSPPRLDAKPPPPRAPRAPALGVKTATEHDPRAKEFRHTQAVWGHERAPPRQPAARNTPALGCDLGGVGYGMDPLPSP